MGLSNKENKEQRIKDKRKEQGLAEKPTKAKKEGFATVQCLKCSQQLRVTKKNTELKSHWENKHPKENNVCFLTRTHTLSLSLFFKLFSDTRDTT